MGDVLTASDYARHRGCSPAAVSKAIESGRLQHSLVHVNGRIRIASAVMADLEWSANTNPSKARAATPPAALSAAQTSLPLDADAPLSFNDAAAAEKMWKARLAEQDFKARAGQLVNAKDVEFRIIGEYSRCRTKLLGLARKAKATLPHLTRDDILAIDTLVREALEDLGRPTHEDLGGPTNGPMP